MTSDDSTTWDARAELEVAGMIRLYLQRNPPPEGTLCAGDFAKWADALGHDGRRRLRDRGERQLRAVSTGAQA